MMTTGKKNLTALEQPSHRMRADPACFSCPCSLYFTEALSNISCAHRFSSETRPSLHSILLPLPSASFPQPILQQ